MPTPSTDDIVDDARQAHATCPSDDDTTPGWRLSESTSTQDNDAASSAVTGPETTEQLQSAQTSHSGPTETTTQHRKKMDTEEVAGTEILTPTATPMQHSESSPATSTDSYVIGAPSRYETSNIRLTPSSPSSFLRSGSKFHGIQQSERQKYDVNVEIKHVDMRESFLCGYLRIQGLTDDHPTLTTYFEGEIIGSKYSFMTQHDDWGCTDKVDLLHWAKFPAFRPFQKQAKKPNFQIADLAQRENIFMRWKEHFLVPDHRIRSITGASFEGFYYICFNQIKGSFSGIYFHAKSEKFQQLELSHVEDRGTFAAVEFR